MHACRPACLPSLTVWCSVPLAAKNAACCSSCCRLTSSRMSAMLTLAGAAVNCPSGYSSGLPVDAASAGGGSAAPTSTRRRIASAKPARVRAWRGHFGWTCRFTGQQHALLPDRQVHACARTHARVARGGNDSPGSSACGASGTLSVMTCSLFRPSARHSPFTLTSASLRAGSCADHSQLAVTPPSPASTHGAEEAGRARQTASSAPSASSALLQTAIAKLTAGPAARPPAAAPPPCCSGCRSYGGKMRRSASGCCCSPSHSRVRRTARVLVLFPFNSRIWSLGTRMGLLGSPAAANLRDTAAAVRPLEFSRFPLQSAIPGDAGHHRTDKSAGAGANGLH